ncbi:ABC transporter ATP-binding protein [Rhodococcus antarcticus]|uniref:ABC transporter ATP-binding protein n=1 Tax=Rhodococcus antarcticus TaxID=2987751 RepID=A0ABY6NXH4_9NOCA|nr:ABC transporter ATP-binding protein [Rhodococcus antarcticus]UZJ23988.1 ABC transporter ATP-binding protein [Rhodococcus antarcticus]
MLGLEQVTVRYGSTTAVDEVSLEVGGDAQVVALLGPSGCGKSTLLRAVAGLEPLTSGRVLLDGADLARTPTHRRGFGLVFQDGQLFPHRDVAANVAFGLRMARWDRRARQDRVAELLELVGLAGLGARRPGELSGGQAQRVALARALAPRPRLLLLDEPLSALDRELRDRLTVDLAAVLRATGTPALVVTHDHAEAAALAQRVAVMDDGVLRQVAPPRELWRRPADARVAAFLGFGLVVDAHVRAGVATCALGAVAVDAPDGPARLGLRAESVVLRPAGVAADVLAATPQPDGSSRLRLRLGALELDAVADEPPAPGAQVRVGLVPRRVAVLAG